MMSSVMLRNLSAAGRGASMLSRMMRGEPLTLQDVMTEYGVTETTAAKDLRRVRKVLADLEADSEAGLWRALSSPRVD